MSEFTQEAAILPSNLFQADQLLNDYLKVCLPQDVLAEIKEDLIQFGQLEMVEMQLQKLKNI